MKRCRFTDLAQKENGFEFCQAFREELDWVIGGKDDTFWFSVLQDQAVKETYIGKIKDGVWMGLQDKRKKENRNGDACRKHYKTDRRESLFYAGGGLGLGQKTQADHRCPSSFPFCLRVWRQGAGCIRSLWRKHRIFGPERSCGRVSSAVCFNRQRSNNPGVRKARQYMEEKP